MGVITCKRCGRPVGQLTDGLAKVRAVCSACLPDPVAMLRFSIALREARQASGAKMAYCAAKVGVTRCQWFRWERGVKQAPPYERRDKLRSLFIGTDGEPIIEEEVRTWPG